MDNSHEYDDILHLPRPVSRRPRMPVADRAAQFAPFAALTGYDAAVAETARLTDSRVELDGEQLLRIGQGLRELLERVREEPAARVVYFLPDGRKEGGAYRTAQGTVKKVEEYEGVVLFTDGTAVPFGDIYSLEILK